MWMHGHTTNLLGHQPVRVSTGPLYVIFELESSSGVRSRHSDLFFCAGHDRAMEMVNMPKRMDSLRELDTYAMCESSLSTSGCNTNAVIVSSATVHDG